MDAKIMLEEVRKHKEACVSAMISGDVKARYEARAAAKTFLISNHAQVLDILDDALTAYVTKGRL